MGYSNIRTQRGPNLEFIINRFQTMASKRLSKNSRDKGMCDTKIKKYFDRVFIDKESTCYHRWSFLSFFIYENKHSSSVDNLLTLRPFFWFLAINGSVAHPSTIETLVVAPPALLARVLMTIGWTCGEGLRRRRRTGISNFSSLLILLVVSGC